MLLWTWAAALLQNMTGLSGSRYFSVTRPVLVSVTGAANNAYSHSSTITVSAQLTALTNSACYHTFLSPLSVTRAIWYGIALAFSHMQACLRLRFP